MDLLNVIYRDDDIVVINKPHNILVHRSRQSRDHVVVLQLLRDQLNQRVYPVHRLDRATSGVLLFALSSEAARRCCEAFEERRVEKQYIAVVRGKPNIECTLDYPLRSPDDHVSREAVTRFRTLATAELPVVVGPQSTTRYALVEAYPLTGRHHQIRRHLKHLRHPVIGDTTYGEGRHNRFFRERYQCHRLLLHAASLALHHPVTGERLVLSAPLPASMHDVVSALFGDLSMPSESVTFSQD